MKHRLVKLLLLGVPLLLLSTCPSNFNVLKDVFLEDLPGYQYPDETNVPSKSAKPTNTPTPTRKSTFCLIENVQNIRQLPELPGGSEGTSIAIVLNYYDFDADKVDIAVNFIPRGKVKACDPTYLYPGDPRKDEYGCYAPAICAGIDCYLGALQSPLRARNVTGASLDELCGYIDEGYPVIVRACPDMIPKYEKKYWTDEMTGKRIKWKSRNHCLVLVGYDFEYNELAFADPLKKDDITWYKIDDFLECYKIRDCNAVIILSTQGITAARLGRLGSTTKNGSIR